MSNNLASTVHVSPLSEYVPELTGEQMIAANPYRPWAARITSIQELTATEKLFEMRIVDERIRHAFKHEPGQFVEVSIFGVGEAPISITSSPTKQGFIELCIRNTGAFTARLHQMQCGDIVGLRGPYGRGFPVEQMKGSDILLTTSAPSSARSRSSTDRARRRRSCSATSSRCGVTATTSTCT